MFEERRKESDELRKHLTDHERALAAAHRQLDEAGRALTGYRMDQEERHELMTKLYAEIERLNGLLNTIYASRGWRLREFVGKLAGRG
jgi:hypothetical protein